MQHALAPEDEARGQFYALLARLYGSGPRTRRLLAALGGVGARGPDDADNPLGAAWNTLILASERWTPTAAEQEYTDLFVGVGRSESICMRRTGSGSRSEKPLVAVRSDLAAPGACPRRAGRRVYEDHLAVLCETMRMLIAGDGDRGPSSIAAQRAFFERHIAPWVFDCCNAICDCSLANYYRARSRIHQFVHGGRT